MKKNLLFVCLGNICRSPSAEGVMKALVEKEGLDDEFFIDSAGTAAYHEGERADSRMRQHASGRGYNLTSIARQVRESDFDKFDYIIAMDTQNYQNLHRMAGNEVQQKKIVKMTDFATSYQGDSVPDPYYGGADGFELVLDILEDATVGFLRHLNQE